jgi:hypothetical protein
MKVKIGQQVFIRENLQKKPIPKNYPKEEAQSICD